jgi:uncharacterized protein YkwD
MLKKTGAANALFVLAAVIAFNFVSCFSVSVSVGSQPKPTPTATEIREFELGVFELSNRERAKRGLPPLIWHDGLADIARQHSADMMLNNLKGHYGSDGSDPDDRIMRSGITGNDVVAENVAGGYFTPKSVVAGWMRSPGHRGNILRENLTHIGVGIVYKSEGHRAKYPNYITQKFINMP